MTKLIAILVAALAVSGAAMAQTPVKIGMITTLSTPGGYLGEDMRDGFQLAIKQEDGKLGGVPVELVVADDGVNPNTAKEIAQRMLQQDGIKIFTGTIFTVVSLAIVPDLLRAKAFVINNNNGPEEFDGRNCQPTYFASAWHNDGPFESAGYAANTIGTKHVTTIAANYYTGTQAVAAFKKAFKGDIIDEILVKLNQTDYAAEISEIKAKRPEGIFAFLPGGMGIAFLRQMQQAGLTGIKEFTATTTDGRLMQTIGDAGKDVVGSSNWGEDLDNAANKQFVTAYRAAYKRVPTVYAAAGYDAARLIGSALKATKGNVGDEVAFRAALKAADFASVRGKISFGKSQTVVQNWYMTEWNKNEAGAAGLKITKTILTDHGSPYADQCGQ